MAKSPKRYLDEAKNLGFKKIIFHYEALNNDEKRIHIINKAKSLNLKVFIALNPETDIKSIFPLLHLVDGVLLMGVHPGAEHQELLTETFSRIKKIRKYNQSIPIQIDGGVNLETIKKLRDSGATIFNSGSFVSSSDNPKEALKQLQEV
jgi:ribulose-phosphate 3-epimerase